jgi:glycosyltransferase involved in cell wall biosynthesis
MRILVLTSRYTASRDIIGEDFGRQIRLFEALKKFNHKIDFFCADYRKFESKKTNLHKIEVFIEPFSLFYSVSFILKLDKTIKKNKYDLLFITSDPLWSIFGHFLSKKYKIPLVYDIQDNFKTYKTFNFPLVKMFHKKAIKSARIVTCASNILKDDIKDLRKKGVITVPNGVDLNLFRPLGMQESRKKLGLPKDAKIISYIGTIQRLAGTDILIKCFKELKKEIPSLHLLIVGRISAEEKGKFDFGAKGLIFKGSITQKEVVYAINASDVLVLPYPLNEFTRVMLAPYKLVEFMACNRPIVITKVGEMSDLLRNEKFVAQPNNIADLANKIEYALKIKKINHRKKVKKFSWDSIAKNLNSKLTKQYIFKF